MYETCFVLQLKVKVKLSHYTMQVSKWKQSIVPIHSWPRQYMGVSGQNHAPAALYPRGKNTRYQLYRRLGGLQSWPGHKGYRKNLLPLPEIEPRLSSQTLYWLSYHSSLFYNLNSVKCILTCKPGGSVSTVSGYRLNEVRTRQRWKDFSSNLCAQAGSGAHPASCTMGTGGPFPGAKEWPGRDADHSIYCRFREWVGAMPLLPSAFVACSGTVY
jgi:hypothetical protein